MIRLFVVKQRYGSAACKTSLRPDWQCNRSQHLAMQVVCPYGSSSTQHLRLWYSLMHSHSFKPPFWIGFQQRAPFSSIKVRLVVIKLLGFLNFHLVWPRPETNMPWEIIREVLLPTSRGSKPLNHNKVGLKGFPPKKVLPCLTCCHSYAVPDNNSNKWMNRRFLHRFIV